MSGWRKCSLRSHLHMFCSQTQSLTGMRGTRAQCRMHPCRCCSLVCCRVFFPLPAPGKDCQHALCRSVGARASRQASNCNDKKTVVFPQRLPVGTDVFAEQLSHGIAQRPAQIAFSSMAEQLWIALFEKRCPRCPSLALADDG